jgi:hypothetical protein
MMPLFVRFVRAVSFIPGFCMAADDAGTWSRPITKVPSAAASTITAKGMRNLRRRRKLRSP